MAGDDDEKLTLSSKIIPFSYLTALAKHEEMTKGAIRREHILDRAERTENKIHLPVTISELTTFPMFQAPIPYIQDLPIVHPGVGVLRVTIKKKDYNSFLPEHSAFRIKTWVACGGGQGDTIKVDMHLKDACNNEVHESIDEEGVKLYINGAYKGLYRFDYHQLGKLPGGDLRLPYFVFELFLSNAEERA